MCVQESGYPSLEIPEFFVPGDTAIGTAWKAGRARDSRVQPPGGVLPERGASTLAWRIPWAEEPSRLQSMGSHTVGHD